MTRDLVTSHNPFLLTNMFCMRMCVCVCVCVGGGPSTVFALEIVNYLLLCNVDHPVLDGESAYQVNAEARYHFYTVG